MLTLEEAVVLGVKPERQTEKPISPMLAAAIADIPHVGRFCRHARRVGEKQITLNCAKTDRICTRQMRETCEQWEWRGLDGI